MAISFKSLGATPAKVQKTKVITSTQSWTVPADVDQIEMVLCGGGGGGVGPNGISSSTIFLQGGAGSAEYAVLDVTPGSTHTVTIGAGGATVVYGQTFPIKGGDSSFGSLLTVSGGYTSGYGTYGIGNQTYLLNNGAKPGGKNGGLPGQTDNSNNSSYTSFLRAEKGIWGVGGGGGYGYTNEAPKVTKNQADFGQDGGGAGGFMGYLSNVGPEAVAGTSGAANTGGGGGGGSSSQWTNNQGAAGQGGSGVAIIKYWSAL